MVRCGGFRALRFRHGGPRGDTLGRLRIFFEPRIHSLKSPLRFARFLAQQAALLLNRLDLLASHNSHLTRIARLQRRLEMRKIVQRAKGILAEMQGIPEDDALALFFRYAHQSRRRLQPLAEAIVLNDETASFRRSNSRRSI